MNDKTVRKTPFQKMSLPTLKAFLYFLFPVTVVGIVLAVISRVEKAISNAGLLGPLNIYLVLSCIIFSGFVVYGMFKCGQELRSRKGASNQPDAVGGK